LNGFACQFSRQTTFAEPTNTVGDDKQVVLGIDQKAVLVLAPTATMGASRHRQLRRHHVAMDRKGCFSRGG
jgi:hypothetical protein